MRREWVSNKVIEEILRAFPEKIIERRKNLADSSWCAKHPETVKHLHDPEQMRRVAETLSEQNNPFSRASIIRDASRLEWRMINTASSYCYVRKDPETGEIVDQERFTNHVDASDPKARAYVARLN